MSELTHISKILPKVMKDIKRRRKYENLQTTIPTIR